jgi:hypothetical protein
VKTGILQIQSAQHRLVPDLSFSKKKLLPELADLIEVQPDVRDFSGLREKVQVKTAGG